MPSHSMPVLGILLPCLVPVSAASSFGLQAVVYASKHVLYHLSAGMLKTVEEEGGRRGEEGKEGGREEGGREGGCISLPSRRG